MTAAENRHGLLDAALIVTLIATSACAAYLIWDRFGRSGADAPAQTVEAPKIASGMIAVDAGEASRIVGMEIAPGLPPETAHAVILEYLSSLTADGVYVVDVRHLLVQPADLAESTRRLAQAAADRWTKEGKSLAVSAPFQLSNVRSLPVAATPAPKPVEQAPVRAAPAPAPAQPAENRMAIRASEEAVAIMDELQKLNDAPPPKGDKELLDRVNRFNELLQRLSVLRAQGAEIQAASPVTPSAPRMLRGDIPGEDFGRVYPMPGAGAPQ